MRVKELQELLARFDPESTVRLSMSLPGRVVSTHENLWVADWGGGPQLNAALDFRPFCVYVGCGMEQMVRPVPPVAEGLSSIDLGEYASKEELARVRDFYIFHRQLDEPLSDPEFDYEHWIPPRTVQGEYNEQIARLLREKLLRD